MIDPSEIYSEKCYNKGMRKIMYTILAVVVIVLLYTIWHLNQPVKEPNYQDNIPPVHNLVVGCTVSNCKG